MLLCFLSRQFKLDNQVWNQRLLNKRTSLLNKLVMSLQTLIPLVMWKSHVGLVMTMHIVMISPCKYITCYIFSINVLHSLHLYLVGFVASCSWKILVNIFPSVLYIVCMYVYSHISLYHACYLIIQSQKVHFGFHWVSYFYGEPYIKYYLVSIN